MSIVLIKTDFSYVGKILICMLEYKESVSFKYWSCFNLLSNGVS